MIACCEPSDKDPQCLQKFTLGVKGERIRTKKSYLLAHIWFSDYLECL